MNDSYLEKYPLLFSVDSPMDIRRMDLCALEELAAQLRSYIIDVVSVRQGHLGSNLGVVELAVALHYVFDTPDEPLVWDVGHQAYAHKILTGRRDAFLHLREYGGISGFPRRDESPYDAFGTGHSSTSVSAVLGMALADKARGIRKNHIAVIGDASIASGMALEALNHAAGAADADMLVVLNDNAMGIDPASGALSRHFKTLLEDRAQDNIFRAMGVKYFKISDGHDIKELVGTLSEIKNVPGVKLLHVPTVKGKGFEAAEKEQILYHYPGVFDRATGQVTRNASLRYQDVAGRELLEVARADSAVYAITPAMPTSSGLSPMCSQMPDRVIDTGIAEEHSVTLAAGMAAVGMKPFVVIYSTFLQRAYDQVIHDVALQNLPVRFLIDRAGPVGADGPTHHGVFDMVYMSAIPNMTVVAPMDAAELASAVRFAAGWDKGPVAVRYPKGQAVYCEDAGQSPFCYGRGRELKKGTRVAVVSAGAAGLRVSQAIGCLEPGERELVGHYDLRFVKPLDTALLERVFSGYESVITVEDGLVYGGVGQAVQCWGADNGFSAVPVRRLGAADAFLPYADVETLWQMCGTDILTLIKAIKENF